ADYSFVNERIAKVYRLPNIVGEKFQRVTVPEERRGILGQGSVLMQTAVADRTSPVQRGKWIMEVLLGSPPPPPPPDVPAFDGTKMAGPGDLRQALLGKSDIVLRNFTDNLLSYALGRRIEYFDQPTVRAIVKKATQTGNHFSSYVLGVVNSPAFQMSTAEAVTTTAQ